MHDALKSIIERVSNDPRRSTYSEQATIQAIVSPVLTALKWTTYDVTEVAPEYTIGGRRVDFALMLRDQPRVFIEVKRCGVDLDSHQEQLLTYAFKLGIPLAILTNGVQWWFFLPLTEGPWERRKFLSLDFTQQPVDEVAGRLITFLSRSSVESGDAVSEAQDLFSSLTRALSVRKRLPEAWNQIVTEPVAGLVDLLRDTVENASGYVPTEEEVKRFLKGVANTSAGISPNRDSAPPADHRHQPAPHEVSIPPASQGSPASLSLAQAKVVVQPKTMPRALEIEDKQYPVRGWTDLCQYFVGHLLNASHLRPSHLPVHNHSRRDKYFIAQEPQHENRDRDGQWKEVSGLFVDTKYNGPAHIKNLIHTLEHVGRPDLSVRIQLRD